MPVLIVNRYEAKFFGFTDEEINEAEKGDGKMVNKHGVFYLNRRIEFINADGRRNKRNTGRQT